MYVSLLHPVYLPKYSGVERFFYRGAPSGSIEIAQRALRLCINRAALRALPSGEASFGGKPGAPTVPTPLKYNTDNGENAKLNAKNNQEDI